MGEVGGDEGGELCAQLNMDIYGVTRCRLEATEDLALVHCAW